MSAKVRYVQLCQEIAGIRAALNARQAQMVSIYFDRGYGAGGAQEIIDADVSELGLTAAQMTSFITYCQQDQNFLDGGEVVLGDYSATLNVLRTDI